MVEAVSLACKYSCGAWAFRLPEILKLDAGRPWRRVCNEEKEQLGNCRTVSETVEQRQRRLASRDVDVNLCSSGSKQSQD